MDSGYPTKLVVKTDSPLTFAFAPKLLPWKIGPSLIVKVARSKEGLSERGVFGAAERGVPLTTVALYLTWKDGLKAFEKLWVEDWKIEGLATLEKMTKVAMVVFVCPCHRGRRLFRAGFPEVVRDVVCQLSYQPLLSVVQTSCHRHCSRHSGASLPTRGSIPWEVKMVGAEVIGLVYRGFDEIEG